MNRLRDWLDRKSGSPSSVIPKQLIENLPQVVFQMDAAGRWKYLSKAWPSLTGLNVDECVGSHYSKAIHPRDRERCETQFHSMSQGGQCTLAIRLGGQNERYQWVEIRAAGLIFETQFCGITGTITNINDRVDEEELLLANQRSLTGMLNDLPGMMYRCRNNIHWTMDYVSAGSLDLTGYPPEDLINSKVISYAGLIHPEDRDTVWSMVQQAVREHRNFELTYRIITAGGHEKWISERGRALFSSNGELLGLEGFMADITGDQYRQILFTNDAQIANEIGLTALTLSRDRIERVVRRSKEIEQQPYGLMAILLDRFPSIRDRGMDPSAIKRSVAKRIQKPLAPFDTVCAIGEQQFLVLTEHVADAQALIALAQLIQDQFLQPIQVKEKQYLVSLSIGVIMGSERHHSADELLVDAETAMHHASALGGNRIERFDPRVMPSQSVEYSLGGITND